MLDKESLKGIDTFKKFMYEFTELLLQCSANFENEEQKIKVFYTSSSDQIKYCNEKKKDCISFFDVNRSVYPIRIDNKNIIYNADDFSFTFNWLEMYFDKNFPLKNYFESINSHSELMYLTLKEIEQSIWIAFYNDQIKQLTSSKEIKPFRNANVFKLFESYMANRIVKHDEIKDISLLFQKLLKNDLIEEVKHKYFINWIYECGYISKELHKELIEFGQFLPYSKCHGKGRAEKFDIHFESIL